MVTPQASSDKTPSDTDSSVLDAANSEASSFHSMTTQALVIGSGISGLFTALKLAENQIKTTLVTKSSLSENNSRYAQGGIAAVLPSNPEDSLELHVKDTIDAGAGLTDETVARSILGEGYPAIEDLLSYGVPFDKTSENQLATTREAAHSVNRIIHAGGDATGASVEMTLIERVRQNPLIEVLEYCQVVELLTKSNRCYGCRAILIKQQQELAILSDFTVLATGGLGRLFSHTTNPPIATGDGISLAHKATARIQHLEFVQFHPTAFYTEGRLEFLISEALRGEGGILTNHNGDLFAKHYHPSGELAPRDIVTRAIYAEMRKTQKPYVYLDITHLPKDLIESRFPTILESCLKFGVDIRKDLIPVAPAAHYLMGGVAVDLNGKSSVDSLYVVGETAYTGLHGANRLASNSLLECVVLARRVAQCIADGLKNQPASTAQTSLPDPPEPKHYHCHPELAIRDRLIERLGQLHQLMWDYVGILRSEEGLTHAIQQLEALSEEAQKSSWQMIVPDGAEYVNQLRIAKLMSQAALQRKESSGAHYRIDSPVKKVQGDLFEELALSPVMLS